MLVRVSVILVYVSIKVTLTVKIHQIQTADFMHKTKVTKHILNREQCVYMFIVIHIYMFN